MPELVYDAHRDEWRYAPSTQENTASVTGCGCMCHVGSGTRTSCEHCSQRRGNQCLVCFDHGDSSGSGELVAAHIGCIRDLEARIEQLEIRDKMRDDGEHSLMGEIEARDVRIAQLERERGVEETNAQRWMTEAEDWKVRAEAAEQRVCELERVIVRWHEASGDCECREVHFLNLCPTCASEEALADIARAILQREEEP